MLWTRRSVCALQQLVQRLREQAGARTAALTNPSNYSARRIKRALVRQFALKKSLPAFCCIAHPLLPAYWTGKIVRADFRDRAKA